MVQETQDQEQKTFNIDTASLVELQSLAFQILRQQEVTKNQLQVVLQKIQELEKPGQTPSTSPTPSAKKSSLKKV